MTRLGIPTVQTLIDGPHHVVMKFTGPNAAEIDLSEPPPIKVDVSTLAPLEGRPCTEVAIDKVYANLSRGMFVNIQWSVATDDDQNLTCLELSNTSSTFDFTSFGGLTNNAGPQKTGDIAFRSDADTTDDTYSIILYMRKKYR